MNELSQHDSQLIDKFLQRSLTEAERIRFNERIVDPLFKIEVEFRSSLIQVSEQKGNEKLYTLLEEENKRLDQQKPKNKYRLYLIGLALLAVAGLCYFLVIHETQPSSEELFLAHYEVFPNLIAPTERSNVVNLNGAELALYAYDNGDFQKAIAVFDTLSQMDTDLMMYHAIAALETGQVDRAENLLITLCNNNQARYREAAEWYLCLLQLKEGRAEERNQCMNKIIIQKGHKYYSKAQRLISDIE